MEKRNILLASILSLILVFAGFNLVKAENGSDDIFDDDSSSDLSDITDDISTSDIVESENEVDSQRKNYLKRTISSGSGWIITGDKGALLNIHLVNGYFDGGVNSKGWIKAGKLKLKIESAENTESKKTFKIISREGVTGTLVLTRGTTYQTGFAAWIGELNIKVGEESYDAKVNLAIEEKSLGEKKLKEQRDSEYISLTGGLELDQVSFDLKGKAESNLEKIELTVMGQNNAQGELVLEKISSMEYIGKLKVKVDGDDDKLVGKLKVVFSTEGNVLYGTVAFANEDGSESTGNIKITLDRQVVQDSDDSKADSKQRSEDEVKEDRSGSNSGSDSESGNRGFWKRFIDFFGA